MGTANHKIWICKMNTYNERGSRAYCFISSLIQMRVDYSVPEVHELVSTHEIPNFRIFLGY
jgi:hypothetical protein